MRFPTCLILTSAVCAVSAYAGVYVALLLAGCVLAAVLVLEAVRTSVCWEHYLCWSEFIRVCFVTQCLYGHVFGTVPVQASLVLYVSVLNVSKWLRAW